MFMIKKIFKIILTLILIIIMFLMFFGIYKLFMSFISFKGIVKFIFIFVTGVLLLATYMVLAFIISIYNEKASDNFFLI